MFNKVPISKAVLWQSMLLTGDDSIIIIKICKIFGTHCVLVWHSFLINREEKTRFHDAVNIQLIWILIILNGIVAKCLINFFAFIFIEISSNLNTDSPQKWYRPADVHTLESSKIESLEQKDVEWDFDSLKFHTIDFVQLLASQ